MLYYLTGMATERSAVIAYNRLYDGLLDLGEHAAAQTVVAPIRRQEPGHYVFYTLSAQGLWARLAGWQRWMVRRLRSISFTPVVAYDRGQVADFGEVMRSLGMTADAEDLAAQISRVERELLWAHPVYRPRVPPGDRARRGPHRRLNVLPVDSGQLDRELPQPARVLRVQGIVRDTSADSGDERLRLPAVLEVDTRDACHERGGGEQDRGRGALGDALLRHTPRPGGIERLRRGRDVTAEVGLPDASWIAEASESAPFLTVGITLEPLLIAELFLDLPAHGTRSTGPAVGESEAEPELIDAFLRLLQVSGSPSDSRVLRPAIVREIHWRLLTGVRALLMG